MDGANKESTSRRNGQSTPWAGPAGQHHPLLHQAFTFLVGFRFLWQYKYQYVMPRLKGEDGRNALDGYGGW